MDHHVAGRRHREPVAEVLGHPMRRVDDLTMTTPAIDATGQPGFGYSYGISLSLDPAKRILGHGGSIEGFVSLLSHDLSTGVTVVLLSNHEIGPSLGHIAEVLTQTALDQCTRDHPRPPQREHHPETPAAASPSPSDTSQAKDLSRRDPYVMPPADGSNYVDCRRCDAPAQRRSAVPAVSSGRRRRHVPGSAARELRGLRTRQGSVTVAAKICSEEGHVPLQGGVSLFVVGGSFAATARAQVVAAAGAARLPVDVMLPPMDTE